MAKVSKARQDECRAALYRRLAPGMTVHCVLRSVSRSGMSRRIDFYQLAEADNPVWLTPYVGDLLGWSWGDNGVRVDGCGMDMGFHVVYSLSHALWPEGFECSGEGCPSNDHSNGDRDYSPHQHQDGGYALRHRWL